MSATKLREDNEGTTVVSEVDVDPGQQVPVSPDERLHADTAGRSVVHQSEEDRRHEARMVNEQILFHVRELLKAAAQLRATLTECAEENIPVPEELQEKIQGLPQMFEWYKDVRSEFASRGLIEDLDLAISPHSMSEIAPSPTPSSPTYPETLPTTASSAPPSPAYDDF